MADDFDAQMYLEDDISFTKEAFSYWLDYKDLCLAHRYNLGFVRYEVGGDKLLCTDLTQKPVTTLHLGECAFLVNDSNPYCGMWIYDRKELAEFMKSPEWKYAPSRAYDIRARCAVGWHGVDMKRYKASIIPLHDLDADTMEVDCRCRLHHMPNNYIGHRAFCTIEFPLRAGKRHMDERTQGVRIKG